MPYLPDFQSQPQRSLQAEATRRARTLYLQRLAELRELAAPLALLDQDTPALAGLGLQLDPGAICLARERVGSGGALRAVVRLYTGGHFACPKQAQHWLDALAGLSYAYVAQDDRPPFPTVLLRKGLLHVRIDLPRPAVQTSAAGAERSAA